MGQNSTIKKRLGIYYFKDKNGILDKSDAFLLDEIMPFLDQLIVVYSGSLTETSNAEFSKYTDIIIKLDKGQRSDGYKSGFNAFEEKRIHSYDEILFFDHALIGPFYDLKPMFTDMENRDVDFWGLHWCYTHKMTIKEQRFYNKKKPSTLPSYLPWSFFAVRKLLFNDKTFKRFIKSIRPKKNIGKSDLKHQVKATQKFLKKGFKADAFLLTDDIKDYAYNPLETAPFISIKDKKSPFLYRDLFYSDMSKTMTYTLGQTTLNTADYIKNELSYDENILWDHVLRTGNQYDIKNALSLTYMLPDDHHIPLSEDLTKTKTALCLFLTDSSSFDRFLNYAKSMPKQSHIFIFTDDEKKKNQIQQSFSDIPVKNFDVNRLDKNETALSALLIECRDMLHKYDIICYAHDKKTTEFLPYCDAETFESQCIDNTLKTRHYVNNVIGTFLNNPRLGILSPAVPFHAGLDTSILKNWDVNFCATVKLAETYHIDALIEKEKPPLAPLGMMFWFRGSALKKLSENSLTEKVLSDQQASRILKHLLPFAVQNAGYFAGYVMTDKVAAMQINGQYHMLRSISHQLLDNFGLSVDTFNKVLDAIDTRVHVIPEKSGVRRLIDTIKKNKAESS